MDDSNIIEEDEADEEEIELKHGFSLEDIMCSICHGIIIHPITILCQHSFCYDCLREDVNHKIQAKQQRNTLHQCPICKERYIFPSKKSHNIMIERIIDEIIPDDLIERRKKAIKKRSIEDQIRDELRTELLGVLVHQSTEAGLIPDINWDRDQDRRALYQPRIPFAARNPAPHVPNAPNPANNENVQIEEFLRVGIIGLNQITRTKKFKGFIAICAIFMVYLFGNISLQLFYSLCSLVGTLVRIIS